jgi:hypothetical protein
MEREMPLSVMYEWAAYKSINPLLFSADYRQSRADWNAGMVAAVTRNTMTALWAKHATAAQPADFMFRDGPRRQKTAAEMFTIIKTAVMLAGGGKRH